MPVLLMKGGVDNNTLKKLADKNSIAPKDLVLVFPGNPTHHGDKHTLYSQKSGAGLADAAANWSAAHKPTLSLPTTNVGSWDADPKPNQAMVDGAVKDLYKALGAGKTLVLPVRDSGLKADKGKGSPYFEKSLKGTNLEPKFWGGVEGTPNPQLANHYMDQLNHLRYFSELIDKQEKAEKGGEPLSAEEQSELDQFKSNRSELWAAYQDGKKMAADPDNAEWLKGGDDSDPTTDLNAEAANKKKRENNEAAAAAAEQAAEQQAAKENAAEQAAEDKPAAEGVLAKIKEAHPNVEEHQENSKVYDAIKDEAAKSPRVEYALQPGFKAYSFNKAGGNFVGHINPDGSGTVCCTNWSNNEAIRRQQAEAYALHLINDRGFTNIDLNSDPDAMPEEARKIVIETILKHKPNTKLSVDGKDHPDLIEARDKLKGAKPQQQSIDQPTATQGKGTPTASQNKAETVDDSAKIAEAQEEAQKAFIAAYKTSVAETVQAVESLGDVTFTDEQKTSAVNKANKAALDAAHTAYKAKFGEKMTEKQQAGLKGLISDTMMTKVKDELNKPAKEGAPISNNVKAISDTLSTATELNQTIEDDYLKKDEDVAPSAGFGAMGGGGH